jgi:hypothetical protein
MISSRCNLTALPDGEFWRKMRCAVVEWAGDVAILDVVGGRAVLDAVWEGCLSGHVFGAEAELRWIRRGEQCHAVLISDVGETLTDSENGRRLVKAGEPRHVYLWGKRSGNLLFEDRLPREFVIRGEADAERRQLRYPSDVPEVGEKARLTVLMQCYELPVDVPEMTDVGVVTRCETTRVSRWVEFQAEEVTDASTGSV